MCFGRKVGFSITFTLACKQRIYKQLQTNINTILISAHSSSFEITVTEKKHTCDKKLVQKK
jgi:hypothetical protein